MAQPACSVVIATRDRPSALRRCLEALLQQDRRDFRVIVVDDHSKEPLDPVVAAPELAELDAELIRLDAPSGPAAARNAGVARAATPFIIFIDDDVVADRRFVSTHLDAASVDPPVVTCGPFVQPADWDPTPWNLWEARQAKKEADAMAGGKYAPTWRQFHTGNNCVPTEIFRAVGGFDEQYTRAEDDEFALRLAQQGCTFAFVVDAVAWHYSQRSLESWLAIPRAYAHFDVLIDRTYPSERYLARKQAELARRRWPLLLARRVFSGRRSAFGVRCSVALARGAYRIGLVDVSMGLFSVAYDLSYVSSMEESIAAQSADGSAASC